MQPYEAFSVLIDTDQGERGSGLLYYQDDSESFYVLTCAHVIDNAEKVDIHLLIGDGSEERIVSTTKDHFYFSPIDNIDANKRHSCDIAIIQCETCDLSLNQSCYYISPVKDGQSVTAIGYPEGNSSEPLLYQQDQFDAVVLRNLNKQNYFQIRVDNRFLNASDREAELKGFSGSPLWDTEGLKKGAYFLAGIVSSGNGNNVSRGRVNVMNARLLQSLLNDTFTISIEARLSTVPAKDIALGYQKPDESEDQKAIRTTWIEDERNKARVFLDDIQLQKAIDECRKTISNNEFDKCTTKQKYAVYAVLLSAYRLAREFEIYDEIQEEMHQRGISDKREDLTSAVRYYEQLDLTKAEQYSEKSLVNNPQGLVEKVLSLAIKAGKNETADPSILSDVIDKNDHLLLKPKDNSEEAEVYQLLGYVFANRFRNTERAFRCLNRSFQAGGSFIVLESLACAYYQHSLRNAYIDKESDRVDQLRIDQTALDQSRDLFLRVLQSGDEMWIRGTFRRAGMLLFKCFWFEHDNYRIYRHYHDVIRYCDYLSPAQKRDLQICYLTVAIQKEPIDLQSYDALTSQDKLYFKTVQRLSAAMRIFEVEGFNIRSIHENELAKILSDVEDNLSVLKSETTDSDISLDDLITILINLYGVGVKCFNWNALEIIKDHLNEIRQPYAKESLSIYVHEIEDDDLKKTESSYEAFFKKHNDVISFNEWCHFYTRNGLYSKTKELYDSVFTTRRYLIENQSDYFYRTYISFYMAHNFDLAVPIKCFVKHSTDIKDPFIRLCFEIELKYSTCCFNDPDQILDDLKLLLQEDVIEDIEYQEKCLIVNMLNCRFSEAAKYSAISENADLKSFQNGSKFEQMLFVLQNNTPVINPYWHAMIQWDRQDVDEFYRKENWLLSPINILENCHAKSRKIIVMDLWAFYYLVKMNQEVILGYFDKIYVTHITVSDAIVERRNSSDQAIQAVLCYFEQLPNIIIQSPTLEEQLELRNDNEVYSTVKSSVLLADKYNCPALIGDFHFEVPEEYRHYIIRPNQAITVGAYMSGILQLDHIDPDK